MMVINDPNQQPINNSSLSLEGKGARLIQLTKVCAESINLSLENQYQQNAEFLAKDKITGITRKLDFC